MEAIASAVVETAHAGAVQCLAVSCDGRRWASGGQDKLAHVYTADALSKPAHRLRHKAKVICCAFSLTDGAEMATGCHDHVVRVWDCETAKLKVALRGHTMGVSCVAYVPGHRQLLSASQDQALILWSLETGDPVRTLTGHEGSVRGLACSPTAPLAVSGGDEGAIMFWALQTGAVQRVHGHKDGVTGIAFHPKGHVVVSVGRDMTVNVWGVANRTLLRSAKLSADVITAVQVSPVGWHLLMACADGKAFVTALGTLEHTAKLTGHAGSSALCLAIAGTTVLTGNANGIICLHDMQARLALPAGANAETPPFLAATRAAQSVEAVEERIRQPAEAVASEPVTLSPQSPVVSAASSPLVPRRSTSGPLSRHSPGSGASSPSRSRSDSVTSSPASPRKGLPLDVLYTTERHRRMEYQSKLQDATKRHRLVEQELRDQIDQLTAAQSTMEKKVVSFAESPQTAAKMSWLLSGNQVKQGNVVVKNLDMTILDGTWRNAAVTLQLGHEDLTPDTVTVWQEYLAVRAGIAHPNINQFYGGVLEAGRPVVLATERLVGCSAELGDIHLNLREVLDLTNDFALGLGYLHSRDIVHGAFGGMNAMVTSAMVGQVADVGIGAVVKKTYQRCPVLAKEYSAPEVASAASGLNAPAQKQADIFSFAVVILELCTGATPEAERLARQLEAIQWPAVKELCRSCMSETPGERPDFDTLVSLLAPLRSDQFPDYAACPPRRALKRANGNVCFLSD